MDKANEALVAWMKDYCNDEPTIQPKVLPLHPTRMVRDWTDPNEIALQSVRVSRRMKG